MSQDLDPWLSLEALAVPPRSRKRKRQGRTVRQQTHSNGYAGVSRRTLQSALHDPAHPLRHVHIGKKVVIRRSWYDQWAQAEECKKAHAALHLAQADATALLRARPKK